DQADASDPTDATDTSDPTDQADASDPTDATDTSDPSLPGCEGTLSFLSDGFCDESNNNEACGWDGGDCCPSTCVDADYTCGGYVDPVSGDSFDCRDPGACENTDEGCSECAPGCEIEGLGDGTCNPLCYNAQCAFDAASEGGVSDCSCGDVNLNEDCVGACFGDDQLDWVDDSTCDDGTYGLDLNCTTWEFDGGDCDDTTDPSDGSDPADTSDPSDPTDASDTSDPSDPTDVDSSCNESFLGDSWCDEQNNTEACGWDGGDCCASTCVDSNITCGLNSAYDCLNPDACENSVDGCSEEDNLTCEERSLNEDCDGLCFPDDYLDWLGDAECDVGQYGLAFNCPAWSYDNGDCEAPDPGDERENVTITVTVDYYFTQSTWVVEDSSGSTVSEEQFFTTFDETQSIPFQLDAGEYCVQVSDSNADGGVSGDVAVNGIIEVTWDTDDYTDLGSFCFTVQ
ncbi:MAG: hypothetical protein HOK97_10740, partial [Deltaproteobacteria bacterium]|nr:hypothetical protein [Deltaproteobacteria bacterium]